MFQAPSGKIIDRTGLETGTRVRLSGSKNFEFYKNRFGSFCNRRSSLYKLGENYELSLVLYWGTPPPTYWSYVHPFPDPTVHTDFVAESLTLYQLQV